MGKPGISIASQPLLIRADADTHIGAGHVLRCLALAEAWIERGGRTVFISHEVLPSLVEMLTQARIERIPSPGPAGSDADAQHLCATATSLDAGAVVIDGYVFDSAYQRTIMRTGRTVMVVDDDAHLPSYEATLILNQNIYAHPGLYEGLCKSSGLLLGADYAMLRREFAAEGPPGRRIENNVRSILITMGGGQNRAALEKAVSAAAACSDGGIELIVLGSLSEGFLESLDTTSPAGPVNVTVHDWVEDIKTLMMSADLAISAGGSTVWELLFTGLPPILMTVADNQEPIAEALEKRGLAIYAGRHADVDTARLDNIIGSLIGDTDKRRGFAAAGQRTIDGRGCERICDALISAGSATA